MTTGRRLKLLANQEVPTEPGAIILRNSVGDELAQYGCGCPRDPFRSQIRFSMLDREEPIVLMVMKHDYEVVKDKVMASKEVAPSKEGIA